MLDHDRPSHHEQQRPLKILLDLQGAQSRSRLRGIGRYSLAMAKAFAAEAGHHEVWVSLNGRDAGSSQALIKQFDGVIPRERMVVNNLPAHIEGFDTSNKWRRHAAALTQDTLFHQLPFDCVWHSSLFEGWADDSTASLGTGSHDHRHAATLYDLIPLQHPGRHLGDPAYRNWYYQRLALLKRCGLLLAISESSRREAIEALQIPAQRISVIHGAAEAIFRRTIIDESCTAAWLKDWSIDRPFVLYAGGYDAHKNVDTLIAAYAELPRPLRQQHQLVLAGRCEEEARLQLLRVASQCRLSNDELIFTGALTDNQLIQLYSGCRLFVAPSLHEGLGLPVLEAMACGAPVIGANTTSLPEVIGCKDALFNPYSPSAIVQKLRHALDNPTFLDDLRRHAVKQTQHFSWQASARKAWDAIERHLSAPVAPASTRRPRPSLIYVSPLPPLRSGIADYSARLLRELGSHYDIEVISDQPATIDPWIAANHRLRSSQWLMEQLPADRRILYHFGNSPFHAYMFELLRKHPGVVVMHDSSLGAARNWMAAEDADPQRFLRELYASHGYAALLHDHEHGRASTLDTWPVNLDILERAHGVIVHSRHALELATRYYGPTLAGKMIPLPFPKALTHGHRRVARRLLDLPEDAFVVCSFGMLAATKLNHRLLAAWNASSLASDSRCHLVFVGERDGGEYGQQMDVALTAEVHHQRIHVTGFIDSIGYADYLAAADAAVQLRTASRGETSAAIFDVLAQGLPLIVNAHGSAAELPDNIVIKLDDDFDDEALAHALESLRDDHQRRDALGAAASTWVGEHHHPGLVALRYRDAIEHFTRGSPGTDEQHHVILLERAMHEAGDASPSDWSDLRRTLVANLPRIDRPRLYVDVTATARSELHAGIERVVRHSLAGMLRLVQERYRIEPVRIDGNRFVHARDFTLSLLNLPAIGLDDDEAVPHAGDLLFSLDWVADTLPANEALLAAWKLRGVRMIFGVHDLLPVRKPAWFPDGVADMHAQWLATLIRHADALLGVSQNVADDLRQWVDEHPTLRHRPLALGYSYSGSDPTPFANETPPSDTDGVFARIATTPCFLMVGTIEPRKGHAFALDAFDQLWDIGTDVGLVIVGRLGWMSDALAIRLRKHPQVGHKLFWLERANDRCLEQLYGGCRALLAASEAEGFGLPLAEAARRGLPVIARDIPVFREIAGTFAQFFDSNSIDSLKALLQDALQYTERHSLPVEAESVLPWQTSIQQLWEMLDNPAHPQWLQPWQPANVTR